MSARCRIRITLDVAGSGASGRVAKVSSSELTAKEVSTQVHAKITPTNTVQERIDQTIKRDDKHGKYFEMSTLDRCHGDERVGANVDYGTPADDIDHYKKTDVSS